MASLTRELLKAAADEGDRYRAAKAKNLAQLLARSDLRLPPDWERVYSLGIAMPIFIMELIWAVRAEARQTALKELSEETDSDDQVVGDCPTRSSAPQEKPREWLLRHVVEAVCAVPWESIPCLSGAVVVFRAASAGTLFIITATVAADMMGWMS